MRLVLLPMDLPQRQQQQHYWPRMEFTTVLDIINMGCNSKPCEMATTTTTTTAAIGSQTHQHLAHSLLTCRCFSWTFSLVLCSQPLPTVFSISKFFSTHAATVVADSFAYFSSSAVSPSSSSYRCDYCCSASSLHIFLHSSTVFLNLKAPSTAANYYCWLSAHFSSSSTV